MLRCYRFYACLTVLVTLLALLTVAQAAAPSLPKDLVEVTAANKVRCVEFFLIDKKPYCSTKPLLKPSVPQGKLDPVNLVFDERKWVAGWSQTTPRTTTVEYIVTGDNINDWQELITSQFYLGLQQRVSPKEFADAFIADFKQRIPTASAGYLVNTPGNVMFEFKINQPQTRAQHEIQRVFSGPNGLHVIHYVIKSPDMASVASKKWVALLNKATVR